MDKLKQTNPETKSGNEEFTYIGKSINHRLLDFWKWSVSDLLSNSTRGILAEFIVGTAIGLKNFVPRVEWDAYDLITDYGARIEVKSAAYIQTWSQKKYSNITFSIGQTKQWEDDSNNKRSNSKRHADIYVFCHLKHKDQETIDPLKLEQWHFYVMTTNQIEQYFGSQKTVSLGIIRKFTSQVDYNDLGKTIKDAYLNSIKK
ncbi:MAG: hypothetical protein ACE364_06475 [Chlorobiota bacterium]